MTSKAFQTEVRAFMAKSDERMSLVEDALMALLAGSAPAAEVTPSECLPSCEAGNSCYVCNGRKAPVRKAPVRKARKAPAKKAATPKGSVVKAHQTVTQLGRRGWNDTFSAQTRLSGLRFGRSQVSLYRFSMDRWDVVTTLRDSGSTVAETMDHMVALATKRVNHGSI